MCSTPQIPDPVTPAPAPAPAAAAPEPTAIGAGRQAQNIATGGTINGPSTRVDRDANGVGAGLNGAPGSGLNM